MKLPAPKEWKLLWPHYLTQFLFGCIMLTYPFFVIYYQQRGLTLTQMAFMWSLMAVAKILFEVPTGVVADVFGRKTSVLIGYIGTSAGWILIPFAPSYIWLIIVLLFTAFSQTFFSGAMDAWVYDLLKQKRKEAQFKSVLAHRNLIFLTGAIIGPLIGAWLLTFTTITTLFYIEGALGVLFSFIILFMHEQFKRKKANLKEHARALYTTTKEGLAYAAKHHQLKLIFVICALFYAFGYTIEELTAQPLFTSLSMPVPLLGIYMSVFMAAIGLAQFLGIWLEKHIGEKPVYLTTTLAAIACYLLVFVTNHYLAAALLFVIAGVATRAQLPAITLRTNRLIPSKTRATILSTQSMVNNVTYIIAITLGGYLMDTQGAKVTIVVLGLCLVPALVAFTRIKT